MRGGGIALVIGITNLLINWSYGFEGNEGDEFFMECQNDGKAHLFNGTENVTTFEIPISAFFLNKESQDLINATNKTFEKETQEIIDDIVAAHEQEVRDIVKQFKQTRRKRFLGRILTKVLHAGKRLFPRAEGSLHRSSSTFPQKAADGTKWAAKTSATVSMVEKVVHGAKWAAKTSAQLGALYAATVVYDKLTQSSEKLEILKNATNFTLIKTTVDSSLNYARNEKIHDLKMLLFFGKLNHLPFIVEYLNLIKAGWIDIERFHIEGDNIIIDTKTKFYSYSGKLCEKHFVGSFKDGYYTYNATTKFIDTLEVQNCHSNIFDEVFCYPKIFNSLPLNISVNHCFMRKTKTKVIFVTHTENYFESSIEKPYPSTGILVKPLKNDTELLVPMCGAFTFKHNKEHFQNYQKLLYTEEILKMNKKLEEMERKTSGYQEVFSQLIELIESNTLFKLCLGILMVMITVSLISCICYINFTCFCHNSTKKIKKCLC